MTGPIGWVKNKDCGFSFFGGHYLLMSGIWGREAFLFFFFVSFSLFLFIPSYHVVSSDLAASSHEAKRPRASLSFPILPSHVCYNFFYDSTVSGTLHENPSILSAHQRSLPVCSIATRFTSTCAELRKVETPTIRRRPA